MDDLVATVHRSLSPETAAEFERRVEEGAAFLRAEIAAGTLESPDFAVGMELEAYALAETERLATLPDTVFADDGPAKELGLHNVEINTPPTAFDPAGLDRQATILENRMKEARRAVNDAGCRLVPDAMWTTPPADGSRSYLADVHREDGVTVATNMRSSPRYCAIDNAVLDWADGEIAFHAPGVDVTFPTILFESLATSIQPHLQIPALDTYPRYYNAAIRTMGPVLALATNSPFLPADLYETDQPQRIVRDTPHECRIPVFEGAINVDDGPDKVRFPDDIGRTADVVDRLVADRVCAPFLREWIEDGSDGDEDDAYRDAFWELDHKRGTYWRWLRSVIGGDAVAGAGDGRSIRIEYRPLPTQPSVADTLAFQWLVCGLIRGLVTSDHPLPTLDWADARECFYDVVERGPDADLAWITADGDRVTAPERVYPDLFAVARAGLRAAGVDDATIDERLAPVTERADRIPEERPATPSAWKKHRVRTALDEGETLAGAIQSMQRAYVERTGRAFVEW